MSSLPTNLRRVWGEKTAKATTTKKKLKRDCVYLFALEFLQLLLLQHNWAPCCSYCTLYIWLSEVMKLNQQILMTKICQKKAKIVTNLKQSWHKIWIFFLTHVAEESTCTCGNSNTYKRVNLLCGPLVEASLTPAQSFSDGSESRKQRRGPLFTVFPPQEKQYLPSAQPQHHRRLSLRTELPVNIKRVARRKRPAPPRVGNPPQELLLFHFILRDQINRMAVTPYNNGNSKRETSPRVPRAVTSGLSVVSVWSPG